jgi:hypothetical protein
MTMCDETLAAVLEHLSGEWSCRSLGGGGLLIIGTAHYSDGDSVELLAQVANNEITLSDGGETLARLELAGVNVETGRARQIWSALMRAHGVESAHGRVLLRGPAADGGALIAAMSDALVNLDGLRLMAPSSRTPRFSERLVSFLQAEFEYVVEHPELRGRSGSSYRVTAAAGSADRPVYIQALAGSSQPARVRAAEHGFVLSSDVDGAVLPQQKLIVLDQPVEQWHPSRLKLLSQVAYIGSWRARERLVGFIQATTAPGSKLLLEEDEQIELADPGG